MKCDLRTKTRQLLIAALAIPTIAATASAGEAPDSATASRLQAMADSAWRVRVTTDRGTYFLVRPRLDVAGVRPLTAAHPSTISYSEPPVPAGKPIPWDVIERVDTQRHARLRGFTLGAAIGATAAATAILLTWGYEHDSYSMLSLVNPVVIVTSAAIGGAFGAAGAATSEPIYP